MGHHGISSVRIMFLCFSLIETSEDHWNIIGISLEDQWNIIGRSLENHGNIIQSYMENILANVAKYWLDHSRIIMSQKQGPKKWWWLPKSSLYFDKSRIQDSIRSYQRLWIILHTHLFAPRISSVAGCYIPFKSGGSWLDQMYSNSSHYPVSEHLKTTLRIPKTQNRPKTVKTC